MTTTDAGAGEAIPETTPAPAGKGPLVYRQSIFTRLTHWVWAISLFFLLLTGLQIFNAHPALYIGQESGFEYDNSILRIMPELVDGQPRGITTIFGHRFDTSGFLGMSGTEAQPQYRAFPAWMTIPSYQDLATGRIVHFFFGWVLVATLAIWLVSSLLNRHFVRDILPRGQDLRGLPADIGKHARFSFRHGRSYSPLQKLSYFIVLVILFPLIILTGLTMSPGINASAPWMLDLFGGRQTARTLHFIAMVGLVLFFVVHILMVLLAGPINELRSMVTGWYRTSPGTPREKGDR
ncbi:cytochrome b/b6 domain-containing protein [Arsenicitalea aurantiaca]|uniref:Cytochrome b/b6 domain-containing protein n=1 Tax=Arsenicitalea aurantiaca TaxID=1783274 RepID=A0A433XLH2_9HYPH|nr:cytochrome b/b6 domain-containing protein [Arsenicitalea aurantiaca]RUT34913.1 cytochrome b/b6 domain-containing protein [Arsenicitalea aurantiaca]